MKSIFSKILRGIVYVLGEQSMSFIFGFAMMGLFLFVKSIGCQQVPEIPERMSPARIVNDYAEIFSDAQQQQLEDSLLAFEKATSMTIVVVATDDFDEHTPQEYAQQIFDEWGMGVNGSVMLLKPRNEYGDAKFFFLHCDILEEEDSEMFNSKFTLYEQDENYYAAVLEATNIITASAKEDDVLPSSTTKYSNRIGGDVGGGGDSGVGHDQQIPEPMSPARLVNDYAGLFSAAERQQLEDSLVAFETATTTQIVVVTVNDLVGADPSEYATQILHEWGVGQQGDDNGIVLLLKPRNEHGGGAVFIAVGYGLEGALPDITASQIVRSQMIPYLKETFPNYYAATAEGTIAIRAAVREEYTASTYSLPIVIYFGDESTLDEGMIIIPFLADRNSNKTAGIAFHGDRIMIFYIMVLVLCIFVALPPILNKTFNLIKALVVVASLIFSAYFYCGNTLGIFEVTLLAILFVSTFSTWGMGFFHSKAVPSDGHELLPPVIGGMFGGSLLVYIVVGVILGLIPIAAIVSLTLTIVVSIVLVRKLLKSKYLTISKRGD